MLNKAYYLLFDGYEDGLLMKEYLDAHHLTSRIAPTPYLLRKELCCGMSLLVFPDQIEAVKAAAKASGLPFVRIEELENPLQSRRDRYC